MGFEIFDDFIGLKLKDKIEEDLADYEEFDFGCNLDDEDDRSGSIYFTLNIRDEEIDGLEGSLIICVSIEVDEDFCISEITPMAKFYSGEDGEPEVDAEEFWTEKDSKALLKTLKAETGEE